MSAQRLGSDQEAALSLLAAAAVRERAHQMLELGLSKELPNVDVDIGQLPATADYVAQVIRANYPDLKIPLHTRWRHFVFGGRDLWKECLATAALTDKDARARAAFDLAIVSVLLDAGAGPDWHYRDSATGLLVGRSEGLALASLRMFESGFFSTNQHDPLRVDATRLMNLTTDDLARGLQAFERNPQTGLKGRAALLARLGHILHNEPSVFALADTARPGGLFDYFTKEAGTTIAAPDILSTLLRKLGPIWQDRLSLGGVPLGDTWRHSSVKRDDGSNGLVPLHKLSQWIIYSLIEPLLEAGFIVSDIGGLTGLAEYRNGGLFIDSGVIILRDRADQQRPLPVDSELVIEWRALTIALLDLLLPLLRERLGVTQRDFPLCAMLEGGTWKAGRNLARKKRPNGVPPLTIVSDGTVF